MALSAAVVKELERELRHLLAEREKREQRIAALEQLLERKAGLGAGGSALVREARPSFRTSTVKEAVVEVLRLHPGYKAADVTKFLRAGGFKTGGQTRLSHRVYNEIWRMEKTGEVVRGGGGFMLKDKN